MSIQIFTKDEVNSHFPDGFYIDNLVFKIQTTNDLVPRAFSELEKYDIISDSKHVERTILYKSESDKNIAISKFAIFNDVAYLSWIWIAEPLRGYGYGKKLVKQTIDEIKKGNVSRIYTLPKSKPARNIFNKFNFQDSREISGWKVKNL